jgi:hypothetical protein
MSSARPRRPIFTEGQYLSAGDLTAAVDYERDDLRRALLSGRSWGIAAGLALVQRENASGEIEMYVEPGIAWDGYGRAVLVTSPAKVTPDLLAGLGSGNQKIWIGYKAAKTNGIAPGFQTCNASDPYTRVDESFEIVAGAKNPIGDRQDGVTIGGAVVADARDMLTAVNQSADIVEDGSVPHQTFPLDKARWLIPLGIVNWQSGAPGKFLDRSAVQVKTSRELRRYAGTVTESVLAADGVIRLRDRQIVPEAGKSNDDLSTAIAIEDGDIAEEDDRGRLIGNELVWVEGNMRVTGDARLFGTKLELRDHDGAEAGDAALYAQRAAGPSNPKGGQDFRITIGKKTDGEDRFTVGPLDPAYTDGTIVERLVVQNDGKIGVNTNNPGDFNQNGNTMVVAGTGTTGMTIVSGAGKTGELLFGTGTGNARAGLVSYDHKANQLSLGAKGNKTLNITPEKQVLIGVGDAADYDTAASTLIVADLDGAAGMTIASQQNGAGRIDFANGTAMDTSATDGYVWYEPYYGRMQFGAGKSTQAYLGSGAFVVGAPGGGPKLTLNAYSIQATDSVSADLTLQPFGGKVGVGTTSPSTMLHVKDAAPVLTLEMTSGKTSKLQFIENGGYQHFALGHDSSNGITFLDSDSSRALTIADGKLGVGSSSSPTTTLHVRGNTPYGYPGDITNYTAIIENQASQGSVLALKTEGAFFSYTNYLTFFNGSDPVGAIKLNPFGSSISYESSGADFAEALPRAQGAAPVGAGRIVGVRGGKLSLDTENADTLLVVTDRAAVVGNMPRDASEHETVALVGQAAIWVDGPVAAGDFIVASGRSDGKGRAVAADKITPRDLARVVGRAWENSDGAAPRRVNTIVGASGAAVAGAAAALTAQEAEIAALRAELRALREALGR